MRIPTGVGPALAALVAFTVLTACGGSPQLTPMPIGPVQAHARSTVPSISPEKKKKSLIFVSDYRGFVDIFQGSKNHKMVGQIIVPNGVAGIATDKADNLYVSLSQSTFVPVYAPPYTGSATSSLDDAGYYSTDVAVSPQGTVGVVNLCSSSGCVGAGGVNMYAEGSAEPCATVTDQNFAFPYYGAFDDRGTLYILGYSAGSQIIVGEIKGGCKATSIKTLTLDGTIASPGGIKIDKAHRIAIEDSQNLVINTYDPPKNGSLGSPVLTSKLLGSSDPAAFVFLSSGKNLYTADRGLTSASEYHYPAGGSIESSIPITGGLPEGVAVTPPLVP